MPTLSPTAIATLTLAAPALYSTAMETDATNAAVEDRLMALEQRFDMLVERFERLAADRDALQRRYDELVADRDALRDQNQQAQARIEAMVSRLKTLEQSG